MMTLRNVATALLVVVGAVASCGGDGGNGPGPSTGLARTSTVGSLDAGQASTLCDWTAAKQGGYGRMAACADGSEQTTDASHASCVAAVPLFATYCPSLTVGDVEDCANAVGSDLCRITTEPACANVRACLSTNAGA